IAVRGGRIDDPHGVVSRAAREAGPAVAGGRRRRGGANVEIADLEALRGSAGGFSSTHGQRAIAKAAGAYAGARVVPEQEFALVLQIAQMGPIERRRLELLDRDALGHG